MYKQLLRDGWSHFKYPNGDDGIRNSDGDIEAFFYCNTIPGHDEQSISGYISRAIDIEGVSFTSLIDMMKWKKAFGRKKDLRDIELIKNFLEQEAKWNLSMEPGEKLLNMKKK